MKRLFSSAAGFLAATVLILASILVPALNPARFERAVLNTVNPQAVGMSESDLTAFARETMAYLRAEKEEWEPVTPFAVPQDFADHMAEVRGWVDVLKIALPLGALLAAAGLTFGRDFRAARTGLLCMLGLLAAMLLWAAVDFNSLWMVIHRVLIPGGIFPAGEPVMQLFPLELFFGYLPPLTGGIIGYSAGLLVLFSAKVRKNARD